MNKYIVLGVTRRLGSRRILGRYKREDELWDVFEVEKLTKTARKLSVFEVLEEPTPDSWYLVSFDIRGWQNKTPSGSIYHKIKKEMFRVPCGKVDQSTYICPTDASDIPRRYTKFVRSWIVRPWNDAAKNDVRESIRIAIMFTLFDLRERSRKLRGAGKKRAVEIAREVLGNYDMALDKLKTIGLDDYVRKAVIVAKSLERMANANEAEDEVRITNELKARIYVQHEDHITFSTLLPEADRETPSIYVYGSIEPIRGWGRVGQFQANVVGDTALIWECLVYKDAFITENPIEASKKVWRFFEDYLKRFGATKFIANPYEPEYDNWVGFLKEMGYEIEGKRAVKKR
jgi:hypothetical protein